MRQSCPNYQIILSFFLSCHIRSVISEALADIELLLIKPNMTVVFLFLFGLSIGQMVGTAFTGAFFVCLFVCFVDLGDTVVIAFRISFVKI